MAFISYTRDSRELHRCYAGEASKIEDWHRTDADAWMAFNVAEGFLEAGGYALTLYGFDADFTREIELDRETRRAAS